MTLTKFLLSAVVGIIYWKSIFSKGPRTFAISGPYNQQEFQLKQKQGVYIPWQLSKHNETYDTQSSS